MTMALHTHPDYVATYSLLDELWAAGGDYVISRSARALLAQALTELTDYERIGPTVPVPPVVTSAAHGFNMLDDLVSRMRGEISDLDSVLRLTRVLDLVHDARQAA
ncbi:MAG: hypothetical protein HZY75_05345 [Nocardioidaceae bacterium]|nr:MAG: hypothetical protein HZY75_05345 [Nocardioidaceae bacterium]